MIEADHYESQRCRSVTETDRSEPYHRRAVTETDHDETRSPLISQRRYTRTASENRASRCRDRSRSKSPREERSRHSQSRERDAIHQHRISAPVSDPRILTCAHRPKPAQNQGDFVESMRTRNKFKREPSSTRTEYQTDQGKYDKLYRLVEKERQTARPWHQNFASSQSEPPVANWPALCQDESQGRQELEEVSRQQYEWAQLRAENDRLSRRVALLKAINDRRNRWLAASDADIKYQNHLTQMAVGLDLAVANEQSHRLQRRNISHNTLLLNIKNDLRSKQEQVCAEALKAAIELPESAFINDALARDILNKCDRHRQELVQIAHGKEFERKQNFQNEMQMSHGR